MEGVCMEGVLSEGSLSEGFCPRTVASCLYVFHYILYLYNCVPLYKTHSICLMMEHDLATTGSRVCM